ELSPRTFRIVPRYDHRLRDLVRRMGDVTVATDLGVPRSTARGWLGGPPTVVVGLDVVDLTEPALRLHSLGSVTTVRRLVAFYVDEHNRVLPHSAFRGQTPDDVYFGTGHAVSTDLTSRAAAARRARVEANRSASCAACRQSTQPCDSRSDHWDATGRGPATTQENGTSPLTSNLRNGQNHVLDQDAAS